MIYQPECSAQRHRPWRHSDIGIVGHLRRRGSQCSVLLSLSVSLSVSLSFSLSPIYTHVGNTWRTGIGAEKFGGMFSGACRPDNCRVERVQHDLPYCRSHTLLNRDHIMSSTTRLFSGPLIPACFIPGNCRQSISKRNAACSWQSNYIIPERST